MEERLQKFLAEAGIASRRKSEELIAAGRVQVNGQMCIRDSFWTMVLPITPLKKDGKKAMPWEKYLWKKA